MPKVTNTFLCWDAQATNADMSEYAKKNAILTYTYAHCCRQLRNVWYLGRYTFW